MHYHVLFCIYNWNYCGTFVVPKFLLPLETLDFTGVYLPVDFIVGNTQEEEVLFPIMKYYHVFANSLQRIIMYYLVPCKQNS